MPVRVVESKQNARLKELRKALSSPGRGAGALVGIEGPKLIEEALRAGLRVKTIFVAQGPEVEYRIEHRSKYSKHYLYRKKPKSCICRKNCSTRRWRPKRRNRLPR